MANGMITNPNIGEIALTSVSLSSNADINTLKTQGVYFAGSSANVQNLPEGSNGLIIVFGQENSIKQIFTHIGTAGSNDGNLYVRNVNDTGWWKYTGERVS